MTQVIVTSPDELKAIISEVFSTLVPTVRTAKEQPDNISLNTAVSVLAELGFPTSKAKIYKLTSTGAMPYRKYGNKLLFSRLELLEWANNQTRRINHTIEQHGK